VLNEDDKNADGELDIASIENQWKPMEANGKRWEPIETQRNRSVVFTVHCAARYNGIGFGNPLALRIDRNWRY